MNFEDLQRAWQLQDAGPKVTLNTDALLKLVRRDQKQFLATIFWRDAREIGVAFALVIYFVHRGMQNHLWTDYLMGLGCLGVGAFMLADRFLQYAKRPAPKDSLKDCIESSLRQVRHQIWLLKNVFWWYLLPIIAPLGLSIGLTAWHSRQNTGSAVIGFVISAVGCALVYWGVYWLNQFAVRKNLEPRRQELESLLSGLK